MKKRITAILLTAVILLTTACLALAAGGVELPMVPIGSVTPIIVKMTSDADNNVDSGSFVKFNTSISNLGTNGLSKAEFVYSFSDGLEFGDDVKIVGIPEGWAIGEVENVNNTLSFTIGDESGTNPVDGRDLDVTFSFKVAAVSGSQLSVNLSRVILYDKYGDRAGSVSKSVSNNTFTTEASVPNISNIGASLRINNTPALRFGMRVDKDDSFYRAFPNGFEYSVDAEMKFGMLIIEETKLSGRELTASTSGVNKIVFEEVFQSNSNELVFVHMIDNVTNYKKNYVFRPFVMYNEEGEYKYHYGEAKTRSAQTVANMELASETSTKKIEMLNKFKG